jgi:hypothetical protein
MFKIIVKHGEKTVTREHFGNPFEAETRFDLLAKERTDGPGVVYLLNGNIAKKAFRIDAEWAGERFLQNDPTV